MASYEIGLLFVGLAILGAVGLPRLVSDKPLSFPLLYVLAGMGLFALPLGVPAPDPLADVDLTNRLTELVVIVSLMGAGLKIDRPFRVRAWGTTWRLLGVTMPLTIAATALLGWRVLGMLTASALLLGAVVAPTDPVLASDVQVTEPTAAVDEDLDPTEQEGEIRFALTSEAGLNDGLAFPFTYLAIAVAAASASVSTGWLLDWVLLDVAYRIVVGTVVGAVVGWVLAWFLFGRPAATDLARVLAGAEALAATLIAYGLAELVQGYGFIAVFVAAVVLRHYEWQHEYYQELHDFAVTTERLLMAVVLLLFGGAVTGGLLAPLDPVDVAVAVALIFVVRPLAGLVGLVGTDTTLGERLVIGSYGIRGIGSFFYLSFALEDATFQEVELLLAADRLWAIVGLVVLLSIVMHGSTANFVMDRLDRRRSDPSVPTDDG
jgi:NhaP-type Na+/H+ or K+/H+ antiporter